MRYFENLWAKTSRDVRDILQTKFFVLSKMVLSKVQSLDGMRELVGKRLNCSRDSSSQ